MNVVKARNVTGWNMSISQLIGKSPKLGVQCGKCGVWHYERHNLIKFKNGPLHVICPYCGTINNTTLNYK